MLKNGHPDHVVTADSLGEFLATCRMTEHVRFADVPHELLDFIDAGEISERSLPDALRSYANGTGTTKVTSTWDKKLVANVIALSCSFTTSSKAEFEDHMAGVHGRTTRTWEASTLTSTGRRCQSVKRGVTKTKRPDEGQPFKPSVKAIAQDLVTCGHCGLVIERIDAEGERFAREHLAQCATASAGAA